MQELDPVLSNEETAPMKPWGSNARGYLSGVLMWLLFLVPAAGTAQQQPVPDAPSAAHPAAQPGAPPAQFPRTESRPAVSSQPNPADSPSHGSPPGSASKATESERDQMFTLVRQVNFVMVPVTVKDIAGRLVDGLTRKDFAVYENGVEQQISLFTSEPFPLSAAIIVDLGLPQATMHKLRDTFPALSGAFSEFDELSLYTYATTVQKAMDFSALNDQVAQTLRRLKPTGRTGGVPVTSGPMVSGPSVNGEPIDPGAPRLPVVRRETSVLNDAILQAALDLSHRDRRRRKIIFLISDGREEGSHAGYSEVLKLLLSNEITVYGVAVDSAALPGYRQLEKMNAPHMGKGDVLPKYASATGGQIFPELTAQAVEHAYAQVTDVARNQYTIGYTTRATVGGYRSIDVHVHRPDLRVYARDGYYPLPPAKTSPPPQ